MQEISKIKIQNNDDFDYYNIKDAELRHMINVLLGIEKLHNSEEQDENINNFEQLNK